MKDDTFRLPRSSYPELFKIIAAYGQTDEPATLSEISALSTIGTSTVSSNNAFLVEIGLIDGGNKKVATPTGRSLARALIHDMKDEIANSWRSIVESNEFLSKMVVALKIRKQMEATALVSHIAYNSGEKKSKGVLTGARAIIDIFSAAELIKEEAGLLVPWKRNRKVMETPLLDSIQKAAIGDIIEKKKEPIAGFQSTINPAMTLSIEINIDANTADFSQLATQVRDFIRTLNAPYENATQTDDE